MAQPNIAKIARELSKFTKNKSKSELSDKLDASSETIQMGEDEFTRHEPQTNPKSTMTPEQFEKLIKMLKSSSKVNYPALKDEAFRLGLVKKGKHDPKEMLDEDGEDLSKDEKVIDEQEEIIRRLTK